MREAQPGPPARSNSCLTRQILLHIQAVFGNNHTVFALRMLLGTQGQQRKSVLHPTKLFSSPWIMEDVPACAKGQELDGL